MLKKFLMATALTAVATSVSAQDRTIRFSNWLPPSHPITKHILEPWAAQVTEATEGRGSFSSCRAWAPGQRISIWSATG